MIIVYSVSVDCNEFLGKQFWCFFGSNHHDILIDILFYDKPWSSTQSQSLSLSKRIKPCSIMIAQMVSVGIHNLSWFLGECLCKKLFHRNLSDKTQSLTVFSVCIGKSYCFCDLPNGLLGQSPQWKNTLSELILIESREKVRLIFIVIDSFEEFISMRIMFYTCVMSCSDRIAS